MSPRRKDLVSLVVDKAEPGVCYIRRAVVVADALPGLIPLLFHQHTEPAHLEGDGAGLVALNKLLPRERLLTVVVLWLAPVLAKALKSPLRASWGQWTGGQTQSL